MKKQIKYYKILSYKNFLGVFTKSVELIHPDNKADGEIIRQLTGQKELNGVIRELIRDLTGGQIQFVETVAPLFD